MNYDLLLHKDIFIPEEVITKVKELQRRVKFNFSRHLLVDRLGNPDLKHNYSDYDLMEAIKRINAEPIIPFEVGLNKYSYGLQIDKYCVRLSYDSQVDICIAISGSGYIITAWCNLKWDTHKTLNRSKYNTKEDYLRLMR